MAIFVGTKVAAKDHAEFINNMELIDAMPPGLYEIVVAEKPGGEASNQAEGGDFDLTIEDRSLDDIRALGCNSIDDEREFAAVARVSELNNALYQTFLQPWIKMVSGPQVARAVLELNPLRLGYSLFSDRNPMMRGVAPSANYVRAERTPASTDNPFMAMQQQFSKTMVDALSRVRPRRRRSPIFVRRDQGPHAQSRAGTYDPDRTGGLPGGRPDRKHVRVGRHCCCSEIIDDLQRAQSKASMQITGRK